MTKDDDDGQTALMLAAATGEPGVLKLVASRLPRANVSEYRENSPFHRCINMNIHDTVMQPKRKRTHTLPCLPVSERFPAARAFNGAVREGKRAYRLRRQSRRSGHGRGCP